MATRYITPKNGPLTLPTGAKLPAGKESAAKITLDLEKRLKADGHKVSSEPTPVIKKDEPSGEIPQTDSDADAEDGEE